MPTEVALVEPNPVVRAEAPQLASSCGVRVVVFDTRLLLGRALDTGASYVHVFFDQAAGMTTLHFLEQMRSRPALIGVVVTDNPSVATAIELGCYGMREVLGSSTSVAEISARVQQLLPLEQPLAQIRREKVELLQRLLRLAPADIDCMHLVLKGLSNKLIAKTLSVSSRTVENRRSKVFSTTGVRNAIELARMIARHPEILEKHKVLHDRFADISIATEEVQEEK